MCGCNIAVISRARFSALQRAENSSIEARRLVDALRYGFSALQRAENSSIRTAVPLGTVGSQRFQCSSASRKFLNRGAPSGRGAALRVSVLFSEPKIPQLGEAPEAGGCRKRFSALQRAENSSIRSALSGAASLGGFSALQRAENSSIVLVNLARKYGFEFQCSSASRKFLNALSVRRATGADRVSVLFSEPKIPQSRRVRLDIRDLFLFQCSSASRKFLNCPGMARSSAICSSFSALQRAENSSIARRQRVREVRNHVSVLFSEPKIPQCQHCAPAPVKQRGFSALQRAENSSIGAGDRNGTAGWVSFSALQRAENSSISSSRQLSRARAVRVSVLFSEPKIPQS